MPRSGKLEVIMVARPPIKKAQVRHLILLLVQSVAVNEDRDMSCKKMVKASERDVM